MGPGFERAAARAGWLLTNDPEGYLILAAIDDPGPGEGILADDNEAAVVFVRALSAGEPFARAALRDLLAYGPDHRYVIDLLGGYTASQQHLRLFSLMSVLGAEPEVAAGKLAMIGDRPLHGEACQLNPNWPTASQVVVEPDRYDWIAANHAQGAGLVRWTEPVTALRAERDRLSHFGQQDPTDDAALASWSSRQPDRILVPIVSLDTTTTAAAIKAALEGAGIDTTEFDIYRALGDKAVIVLPGITIGPGRYNSHHPHRSRFDFNDAKVSATGRPSHPVTSLRELTQVVTILQAPTANPPARLTITQASPTGPSLASTSPPASGPVLDEPLTRDDLLDRINASGRRLTNRNLTYYTTEGLIPAPDRVGTRPARYPTHVYELVCWIIDSRSNGLSLPAIQQLVPLHRYLSAVRTGTACLHEVQAIVGQVTDPQAIREVPWMLASRSLTWDTVAPVLTVNGRPWTFSQPATSQLAAATSKRPTLRRSPTSADPAITV